MEDIKEMLDLALTKIKELEKRLEEYYHLLIIENELDFIMRGTYVYNEIEEILNGTYT